MQGAPLNELDTLNLVHFDQNFGLFNVLESNSNVLDSNSNELGPNINTQEVKHTKYNFSLLAKVFKSGHIQLEKFNKELEALTLQENELKECYNYFVNPPTQKGTDIVQLLINDLNLHRKFNDIILEVQEKFHKNYIYELSKIEMARRVKNEQIDDFKKDLEDIQQIVADLVPQVDVNDFTLAKAAIKSMECPICTTYEVTHAISGCGHTFCGGCVEKLNKKCATCNTSFVKPVRIYFSS